jgi:hypothetical protein
MADFNPAEANPSITYSDPLKQLAAKNPRTFSASSE